MVFPFRICLFLLIFSIDATKIQSEWQIQSQGWDILTDQWPLLAKNEYFYFHYDPNSYESNIRTIRLQFNETFIEKMLHLNRTVCTIDFKLWFFAKKLSESTGIHLALSNQKEPIDLSQRYSNYSGQWVPVRFQIDSNKLSRFQLYFFSGTYFVAFKTFRVSHQSAHYQTNQLIRNPLKNSSRIIDLRYKSLKKICLLFLYGPSKNSIVTGILSYLLHPLLKNNSLQNYISRVPFVEFDFSSKNTNQSISNRICLYNYLNIESKDSLIIVELNSTNEIDPNLTITTIESDEVDHPPLYFLKSFSNNSEWISDWFKPILVEKFQNNFKFEFDQVLFTLECPTHQTHSDRDPNKLITFRLSSKWIQYRDEIFSGKKFSYTVKHKHLELLVYPRLCDQLGHCWPIPTIEDQGSDSITFTINHPTTEMFRLEFVFESYWLHCLKNPTNKLNAILKLLYFGDPCSQNFCENDAICQSNTNLPYAHCSCPIGFYGDKCQWIDFCYQQPKICGGFECINTAKSIKCLCNQTDYIIWNGTNCIGLDSSKFPLKLKLNHKFTNTRFFSVNFNKSNLDYNYDLCFNISYEIDEPNPLLNFESDLVILEVKIQTTKKNNVLLLSKNLVHASKSSFQFCLVRDFLSNTEIWTQLLRTFDQFQFNFHLDSNINSNFSQSITFNYINFRLEPLKEFNQSKISDKNIDWKSSNSFAYSDQIQSDWCNFKPKFDSFQFEFDSNIDNCDAALINANVVYFHSELLLFGVMALNYRKIDSFDQAHKYLKFSGLSELGLPPDTLFKIIISIACPVKWIRYEDLLCQDTDCNDKGHCYGNYQLGIPFCQCIKGYFGSNCEKTDPCLMKQHYCQSLLDDNIKPNLCQPIDSENFECSCSWTNLFAWNRSEKNCQPKVRYWPDNLDYDSYINPYLDNVVSIPSNKEDWIDSFKSIGGNLQETFSVLWKNIQNQPIYFALIPEHSYLSLNMNLPSKHNLDVCFDINYVVPSSFDLIGLKMSQTNQFLYTNLTNDSSSWLADKICISQWVESLSKRVVVNITAIYESSQNQSKGLIAFRSNKPHQVSFVNKKKKYYIPNLSNRQIKNDANILSEQYWSLMFPSFVWNISSNGSVIYGNYSNCNQSVGMSYLLSDWISYSRDYSDFIHRFRFNINENVPRLIINPILLDGHHNDITPTSQLYNQTSGWNVFEFHLGFYNMAHYRIGLRILDFDSDDYQLKRSLVIDDYDLDDFCVGNQCLNGNCLVNFTESNRYRCECWNGFWGEMCEKIDFCAGNYTINGFNKTGKEICRDLTTQPLQCINLHTRFRCDCSYLPYQYWDPQSFKCKKAPSSLYEDCGNNQVWINGKCDCNKQAGYVRNLTGSECILANPCLIQDGSAGCPLNSQCFTSFWGSDTFSDRHCPCNYGYRSDGRDNHCISIYCNSPILNDCSQLCYDSDRSSQCTCSEGYKLDQLTKTKCLPQHDVVSCQNSFCDEIPHGYCDYKTGRCQCNEMFLWNETAHLCQLKSQNDYHSWACPPGMPLVLINSSKRYGCDCDKDIGLNLRFQFDSKTSICHLMPICSENGFGQQDCQSKRALCLVEPSLISNVVSNSTIQHYYRCVCPPGQHFVTLKNDSQICLDHCQDPEISKQCQDRNAQCDSMKNLIFSTSNKDWCDCAYGTVKVEDPNMKPFRCVYSGDVYSINIILPNKTFELSSYYLESFFNMDRWLELYSSTIDPLTRIENSLNNVLDGTYLQQLFEDYRRSRKNNRNIIRERLEEMKPDFIKTLLKNLLQQFLGRKVSIDNQMPSSLSVKECFLVPQQSSKYNCSVLMTFDSPNSTSTMAKIRDLLQDWCFPFSENQCFIETDRLDQNWIMDSLEDLSYEKRDPCSIGPVCSKYPGTVCKSGSNVIQCRCVNLTKYKDIWSPEHRTENGLDVYDCKLNDDYICDNLCPNNQTESYNPGHCQPILKNFELRIHCTCDNHTDIMDMSLEQLLVNENGFKIIRTNQCQKEPKKQFPIALIVISITIGVIGVIMLISMILWCRTTFSKPPNVMDRKYSLEMSERSFYRKHSESTPPKLIVSSPLPVSAVVEQPHQLVEQKSILGKNKTKAHQSHNSERVDLSNSDEEDQKPYLLQPSAPCTGIRSSVYV